jgi:hypothetical protein
VVFGATVVVVVVGARVDVLLVVVLVDVVLVVVADASVVTGGASALPDAHADIASTPTSAIWRNLARAMLMARVSHATTPGQGGMITR